MILGVENWNDFWLKNPLWFVACGIGVIMGLIFIKRARKMKGDVKSQKQVFYGYSLFYFMYIITRILFIFSDIARINHSSYYDTFVSGAYIFTAIALLMMISTIEKYLIKKTKRIFTFIVLAGLIFILVLFFISTFEEGILSILRTINTLIMLIGGLLIFILYSMLVKYSVGTLRRNSIFSLIGIITIALGMVSDMDALSTVIPLYIPPIIVSIGAIIFGVGQKPL